MVSVMITCCKSFHQKTKQFLQLRSDMFNMEKRNANLLVLIYYYIRTVTYQSNLQIQKNLKVKKFQLFYLVKFIYMARS